MNKDNSIECIVTRPPYTVPHEVTLTVKQAPDNAVMLEIQNLDGNGDVICNVQLCPEKVSELVHLLTKNT